MFNFREELLAYGLFKELFFFKVISDDSFFIFARNKVFRWDLSCFGLKVSEVVFIFSHVSKVSIVMVGPRLHGGSWNISSSQFILFDESLLKLVFR